MRKKSKFHMPLKVVMNCTIRIILISRTTGCSSEKYTNVLIRLIAAGQDSIWQKKMKAFIEAERALTLKMITTKKNTVNGA